MARFALQSPPDAHFRQVTLPKTDWSESAWRGAGCLLGPVRRIRGGERQTAGIAGKVVHSNTRIHRMILFINSAFIGIVKSK